MIISIVSYSFFLALLLTGAQVLFKIFALSRVSNTALHLSLLFPLGGALILYFVVFLLYAHALRRLELSLLYPSYTALSILFTYIAGVIIFREQVSVRAVIGCILLFLALYLLATSSGASTIK